MECGDVLGEVGGHTKPSGERENGCEVDRGKRETKVITSHDEHPKQNEEKNESPWIQTGRKKVQSRQCPSKNKGVPGIERESRAEED